MASTAVLDRTESVDLSDTSARLAAVTARRADDHVNRYLGPMASFSPTTRQIALAELAAAAQRALREHTTDEREIVGGGTGHMVGDEETGLLQGRGRADVRREIRAHRRADRIGAIQQKFGASVLNSGRPGELVHGWLSRRAEAARAKAEGLTVRNLGIFAANISATSDLLSTLEGRTKVIEGKVVPVRKFDKKHDAKIVDARIALETETERYAIYTKARDEELERAKTNSVDYAGIAVRAMVAVAENMADDMAALVRQGIETDQDRLTSARARLQRLRAKASKQTGSQVARIQAQQAQLS